MRRRSYGAVVNAGMAPEDVAEKCDIPLGAYLAHGNGYVTVDDDYKPERKPKKGRKKAAQSDVEAPQSDADDVQASE